MADNKLDGSTADVLLNDLNDFKDIESLKSDLGFDNLDEVVYNSSSSFDISEIADLLLDNIDEFVFITDAASKNIVYINKPLNEALGLKQPFVGTCYSIIKGKDEPCKECKSICSKDDKFHINTLVECALKDDFIIKSRNINIYDRTYIINVAIQKKLKHSVIDLDTTFNDVIAPYTVIFSKNIQNPDILLYRFLEHLGSSIDANAVFMYEHVQLSDEHVKNRSNINQSDTIKSKLTKVLLWTCQKKEYDVAHQNVPVNILDSILTEQIVKNYTHENASYFALPVLLDEKILGAVIIKNANENRIKTLTPCFKTIINLMASALHNRIMQAEITNYSNLDPLTKLKNRKCLITDIPSLSVAKKLGVIFINVNGLKNINNTSGIDKGDTILKKTASLLKQLLHHSEYIYRLGGDEFIGIYPDIDEHEFILLSDMIKAFMSSDKGFSASVGTSWINSGMTIQNAINKAESDMYKEKKKYYRISKSENERYRIQNDLIFDILEPAKIQELIAQDCFKVLYQPKFKIQGDVAQIAGAEALVRLIINDKVIPPDDFIPALESAHYTHLIDYFVFETICKQMRERLDKGEKILPVSCNFSRHSIIRPEFKTKLKEILNKYDITPNYIPLEVSEHSSTEHHKELVEVTEKLSKEGFNISIDDFGTAHANIYTLADLTVSEIKFDKKLIDNLGKGDDEKLTTILGVLITMCKKLGIKTIAEGVEDVVQKEILKSLGCDEIQGYYYSKPIVEDDYYSKL